MAKIRKAVFRSGIVMLSLLAAIVLSSSVAQAQECLATAKSKTVRVEGLTEVVGDINLRCRFAEAGFGVDSTPLPENDDDGDPTMVTITVELNADITNEATDDTVAFAAEVGYDTAGINLSAVQLNSEGALTDTDITIADTIEGSLEESNTIEWEIAATTLRLTAREQGFSLTISGIRVDASAVGAGEDVTAVVSVDDEAVHNIPRKVAGVSTGLVVEVDAASGLQCVKETQTATITIKEGFKSAFTADHSFTLTFRNIPEGVMVMTSRTETSGVDDALRDDKKDLAEVMIQDGGSTSGLDDDGYVELTATGTGEVTYDFVATADDDTTADVDESTGYESNVTEWLNLEVTFKWAKGAVPLGSGSVIVSFNPVSTTKLPRFGSGSSMSVVEVEDCTTSLTFPFVTNLYDYDTGIALTNTSDTEGECMVSFSGMNAPTDDHPVTIPAGMSMTFGLGGDMGVANKLHGHIMATCDFRGAEGFAFITNGFGSMGGPTAAQGYIALKKE